MDSNEEDMQSLRGAFLRKLERAPDTITFDDAIAVIDAAYHYTPAAFVNGDMHNAAGQNTGSCKLLAFGLSNALTVQQTLACFGSYYRDDVLKNPGGNDHPNIRNFIRTGWAGVRFSRMPLQLK